MFNKKKKQLISSVVQSVLDINTEKERIIGTPEEEWENYSKKINVNERFPEHIIVYLKLSFLAGAKLYY